MRYRPDRIQSAADASRQVGAVDEMPNPIVAPNANRIDESAVATSAPRITGVQCRYLGGTPMGVAGSIGFTMSPQPEERQYRQDDDNQAHQINQPVHFSLLALLSSELPVYLTLSDTLFPAASTTRPTFPERSSIAALAPSIVSPSL